MKEIEKENTTCKELPYLWIGTDSSKKVVKEIEKAVL